MTEFLFIRFHNPVAGPVVDTNHGAIGFSWKTDNDDGMRREVFGNEDELKAYLSTAPVGKKLVIIVPGESACTLSVFVPSQKRKQIEQALPFIVEDQLFSELSANHFAILNISKTKCVDVAVIAHDIMQKWLQVIQELPLKPVCIVPDIFVIPYQQDTISVFVQTEADKAIVRSGDTAGIVCRISMLPVVLRKLALVHGKPDRSKSSISKLTITLFWDSNGNVTSGSAEKIILACEAELGDLPNVQLIGDIQPKSFFDAVQFDLGINLMQGKYSGEKAKKFKGINFRSVALALSVVMIFQIGINFLSALYLESRASQLEMQSLNLYQELYPEDTRIVNIRTQMENHLKTPATNASEDSFIELLAAIAGQLGADMQLQTITFSIGDKGLTVELTASSLAQLDALESALNSMGYPAEITYANQNNQIISGRISILPKPVGV